MSRDQVPPDPATVPRDAPFSNTSTVVPLSTVPSRGNELGTDAPEAGDVNPGAGAATVSTWMTRIGDADDVPLALLARAETRCAPSVRSTVRVHETPAFVTLVPSAR